MPDIGEMIHTSVRRRRSAIAGLYDCRNQTERCEQLAAMMRDLVDRSSLCVMDGKLMWFNTALYVPVEEKVVVSIIRSAFLDYGAPALDVKRVGNIPFVSIRGKVKDADPNLYYFSNGWVVDISDGSKKRPSRRLLCTKRLDVPWVEEARAPRWDTFLRKVLPDESMRMVLQEFMGMCFIDRSLISIEKLLILVGTGANGKSVVFDVIKGVLGADNLCYLDPAQLCDPKQVAFTMGKMMNFSPDVRVSAAFDSALKSLASSQEVNGWRLFSGSVTLRCPPLVFALNEMPRFMDTSNAFFRRLLVLRFGVTVPPSQQDQRLATRIVDEDAPGVLQWIYAGTRRLLANEGKFTYSDAVQGAVLELQRRTVNEVDIVGSWIRANHWSPFPMYLNQEPAVIGSLELRDYLGGKVKTGKIASEMDKMGVRSYVEDNEKYYYLYRDEN